MPCETSAERSSTTNRTHTSTDTSEEVRLAFDQSYYCPNFFGRFTDFSHTRVWDE
jgi:hypothetical protein